MIVVDPHVFSAHFIETAIGPREDDISRLEYLLHFFGGRGKLEADSVVIGRRGRTKHFYQLLHYRHLKSLHHICIIHMIVIRRIRS